jgi:uncharacterized iron-regulated membrane protein
VRRLLFWIHLCAGVTAGLVVLVMSVTGVLLAYEKQVTAWADRGYRSRPPADDAPAPSVESLLAGLRESRPEFVPTAVTVRRERDAPLSLGQGRAAPLYVDRYSGVVLGEGSRPARNFFRGVEDWHRWLAAKGDGRAVGRGATGACNLAFLVLVASGVVLWWPRDLSRSAVANITLFRGGLRGRARDFNWHNVAGFWSALPLFVIVLCGVPMSYPWATDLLYRLTGSPPPPRPASAQEGRSQRERPSFEGWDRLFAAAETVLPEWQSLTLRVPASADENPAFTIDAGTGGRPDLRGQLVLDRRTAAVVRWEPFSSQSPGRRLRSWARFVHTGEAGGIAGQTVAAFASSGAVLLGGTGLAMAWRRFRQWRARSRNMRLAA